MAALGAGTARACGTGAAQKVCWDCGDPYINAGAHAEACYGPPPIAYYGHPEAERLLVEGIPLEDDCAGCPDQHICLGWSPGLSRNFGPVLEVDVRGLPVEWDLGEGRIHEPIGAEHVLRILPEPITPNWDGWQDPALRTNHRACLARYYESRAREPEAASPLKGTES